jgi:phenylglyoxylate dehydrogenase epsilon subunit
LKKRKQIIIGSGTAALSALRQIRKAGCDDEVALLTMENYAPYSPMSLPYIVSERVTGPSSIQMVSDNFFDVMGATFLKEAKVTGIIPPERKVVLDGGKSMVYDRLLIATGSDPIIPEIAGKVGGMGFHVMDDCLALIEKLKGTKKVAILGAGLVAMEMAAALREKNHEVIVIAPRERILRNYFDIDASGRIISLFEDQGVTVHLNWGELTQAERAGNSLGMRFGSGETVGTDILLACIGVKARTSFLTGSGISIGQGIKVDRQMKTNVPDIFAAGDVAEAADFFSGRQGVNPILPSAVGQGKTAGNSMADQESVYEGWLSMNTFNFFGHLATSVGKTVPDAGDDVLVKKNGGYGKVICREGKLLGAAFLDTDIDAGVIQYLIRRQIDMGKYKDALLETPREVAFWLMHEAEKADTITKEE